MGGFGRWIGGGLGFITGGPLGALLGFLIGSVIDNTTIQTRVVRHGTTPGAFGMSLLVLVAAVMKADGKVVKAELDYVKHFFSRQFGNDTAAEAVQLLRDILKQEIPLKDV